MKNREFDFDQEPSLKGRLTVILGTLGVLLLLAVIAIIFLRGREEAVSTENMVQDLPEDDPKEPSEINVEGEGSDVRQGSEEVLQGEEEIPVEEQDPLMEADRSNTQLGAGTELTQILTGQGAEEISQITLGIDVSRYQGTIDWAQVAQTGVDFAIVRVGYRTLSTGEITEDSNARYNLQEATAHGIKAGAYFFSTAVTEQEAVEEANWTADFISRYKITYPVVYDCEGYERQDSRQYSLTKEERTGIAKAFLNAIHERGYTPMFYASKGEMEGDLKWITSELEKSFKIWVSWYPSLPYPDTQTADYAGNYDMWQYTNNGSVPGIAYPVDVNIAYFGYEGEAGAQDQTAPEAAEADVEALMNFQQTEETVTAKDVTNLRDIPGQGEDSKVLGTLTNGETALRTGISPSGWSRVEIEGQVYYAVSNFLTTDLSARPEEPEIDEDGIKTPFVDCNEQVTPKIEINLRTLPSVTHPEAAVVATIPHGEVITRTGINTDYGWSRVEYNGQILYCVSSYLQPAG
ncbi:MAG: glycoside hydrolase family 25 [Lachnospiraceae bacterium]|nr:glycoside hydrolase family 25 [Lachnospiraceae bacterium]